MSTNAKLACRGGSGRPVRATYGYSGYWARMLNVIVPVLVVVTSGHTEISSVFGAVKANVQVCVFTPVRLFGDPEITIELVNPVKVTD